MADDRSMWRRRRLKAPQLIQLIQPRDFVTRVDRAFYQHGRVDSGFAVVVTGYAAYYVRVLLRGFGVHCDHFAPGIALKAMAALRPILSVFPTSSSSVKPLWDSKSM
jgi:hypothetical protein